MSVPSSILSELRRRNVFRAGALYIGAIWALTQGIAQLGPAFGAPEWTTRWFVIAGVVGFPFWLAFAWFFEFTPEGLKRERDVEPGESITHHTGRKLDFWIIGVLAVAVVLLLTNQLVTRHGAAAPISDQSIEDCPASEGGLAAAIISGTRPSERTRFSSATRVSEEHRPDVLPRRLSGIADVILA